jgi:hypothetical protein
MEFARLHPAVGRLFWAWRGISPELDSNKQAANHDILPSLRPLTNAFAIGSTLQLQQQTLFR